MLADYRNRVDADPRVRDLGYAASFLLDPIGEYPNLVARAEVGTGAATSFVRAAQGYARESAFAGTQRRPAPAGMAWRECWAWFDGELADVNGVALALNLRLTGRDLRAEVLDAYRSAAGDSARFTYGVLIASQAPETITADQVVALQEDGGALSARLARLWRNVLLRSGDPAPDSVAGPLLEALLAKLLGDTNPAWEEFDPDAIDPVEGGAVLITEGTPFLLSASARLPTVTLSEWQDRRPPLPDRAIRLGTPVLAGPFIRLNVTVEERFVAGTGYSYFARFATIVLQRTSTGWRVLETSQAVT
jgi:hypothetical protein